MTLIFRNSYWEVKNVFSKSYFQVSKNINISVCIKQILTIKASSLLYRINRYLNTKHIGTRRFYLCWHNKFNIMMWNVILCLKIRNLTLQQFKESLLDIVWNSFINCNTIWLFYTRCERKKEWHLHITRHKIRFVNIRI